MLSRALAWFLIACALAGIFIAGLDVAARGFARFAVPGVLQ